MKRLLLAALFALGFVAPLAAQTAVNTNCNTFVSLYPAASRGQPISVDQFGATCISGTITATVDTSLLATAANQTSQITQETAINTLLGAQADAACATDNGTCTLAALVKRLNQRLTTINTTLGSPFQAGGSIGNTSFTVTNAGTFAVQAILPTSPTIAAGNGVVPATSSEAGAAPTSASGTAAASNLVLKSGAGNLYDLTVTLGATSGYVMLFDATALPSNGAVTPVWCAAVTSNGTNGGISASWPVPKRFGTGITAGFSTTGCFTLTASATANFFGDYK